MNAHRFASAIAVAGLLGLAACGDDSKLSVPDNTIAPGVTVPNGVTLPPGVTFPAGVGGDCAALAVAWSQAIVGTQTGQLSEEQIDKVFGDLDGKVPADLKDDLAVLQATYAKFAEVLAPFNGDLTKAMTDPKVQSELSKLSTPEVNEASDNLDAFFDEKCGGTS